LMDSEPASGHWMWAANRANYSHATLTRPVDLTGVDEATLNYHVYYDIETGYDFAYLFVSEDDGQTWQPLVAQNMAGPEADPSESALADRFYTDRSEQWLAEQVDLTPYAGQEILIRFAYVTDPILTMGGIAIDNIAIPEIAFYDDVETTSAGWTGLGFERLTAAIPQQWHLQLITFPGGIPQVETLPLSSEQTVSHLVDLAANDGEAILIVAASAPMTLEPAHYRLGISE
jgi:immune inhibitor A